MTIVDDTRLATLARTLADLQRAHADLEMDFTKARVALGRHRHSTATIAEDIERVVALADRPASLASPAAVEMAGAPPTRAGALHDAMLSATARQAGIRSASIDPGAPAVDFSRFDPRIDKNRGGTCSCGHGATAHADLRDGVSRCGDCGCHLFVADHAGLTSPEMRAVNAARKAPLVAEMEAALGHGNQDPPTDPAALLHAAIAQQVRRSACDPAGLLALAQALEAVNRAAPVRGEDPSDG